MKNKIFFMLPFAEGVVNKELSYKTKFAGGAELQSTFLAGIIKDKYDVSFLSIYSDNGDKNTIKKIDGISFIKAVGCKNRSKITKAYEFFIKPVLILLKCNPEYIYIRANAIFYFALFVYSKLRKVKIILHISSDMEVEPGYRFSKLRKKLFSAANKIICQNSFQFEGLNNEFRNKALTLPNIFPVHTGEKHVNKSGEILWVGNISNVKQPEIFLDIVRALPSYNFVMVGLKQNGFEAKYKEISEAAEKLQNLKFYNFINFYDGIELFKSAKVLINTSLKEGFPNTFLQAMATDTAILSLNVDPDKILADRRIGYCMNGNFEQLLCKIKEIYSDIGFDENTFINTKKFLEEVNSVQVLNKYKLLFSGN